MLIFQPRVWESSPSTFRNRFQSQPDSSSFEPALGLATQAWFRHQISLPTTVRLEVVTEFGVVRFTFEDSGVRL